MASLNKMVIIGNLGGDPVLRTTANDKSVANFSVAVNDKKKVDGEWVDKVIWFKVTCWDAMADNVAKYLTKGSPVYVEGRIELEEWVDRDDNTRTDLKINATNIVFLGSGEGKTESGEKPAARKPVASKPVAEIADDEVPF